MPGIERLGHTGVWVEDLEKMRDFYSRVIGLQITDEDPEAGMVFFSSRPEEEHHEFMIARGRQGGPETKVLNQISWRLDSLEALLDFHKRFKKEGVEVQRIVTHGNAIGIYFLDPEGNRGEVYWGTGDDVPQPFGKPINLDQSAEEVLAESRRLVADGSTPRYQPAR